MNKKVIVNKIEWTRINNDTNGNPRYVCHYSELNTEQDKTNYPMTVSPVYKVNENLKKRYEAAVKRANEIGGKKYQTKNFGGGIVFQTFNLLDTERQIKELLTPKN